MSSRAALVLLLFAVIACRTGRPSGSPVAALTATTPEQAIEQLRGQRANFRGMRSLMRVRATVNGKTQSFRAQLAVHDTRSMELIAYTPVGTTALKMKAEGDRITTDPEVAPDAFGFLRAAELTPAETGMLLLGIPPRDDVEVEATAAGLTRASAGGMAVTFDPPSFPAQHVTVARGADRIEITHEEVVREN